MSSMALSVPHSRSAFPARSHWFPKVLVWWYAVEKTKESGLEVSTSAALCVPAHFALPALETILKEFAQAPGRASLALNVRQLHLPFEATICVAVHAQVVPGEARNQWQVHIRAAQNEAMYPEFHGLLTLMTAGDSGSQLKSGRKVHRAIWSSRSRDRRNGAARRRALKPRALRARARVPCSRNRSVDLCVSWRRAGEWHRRKE